MKILNISDYLQLVSSIYVFSSLNESILKKSYKNLFSGLCNKMWFSKKNQKLLYLDKALWPNHLTHIKPL